MVLHYSSRDNSVVIQLYFNCHSTNYARVIQLDFNFYYL
jgi:hypothetical protein